MKYIKKPIAIEAFSPNENNHIWPKWAVEAHEKGTIKTLSDDRYVIKTLECNHICLSGDYIVKGAFGEIYCCKKEIFEATYFKVESIPPNFEKVFLDNLKDILA